ncbi:hypothetical protein DMO16_18275 [Fictibacillus sp. S7]|nr:hypothetical protein DMO16_18275 [Fictibacillus sp. S7]
MRGGEDAAGVLDEMFKAGGSINFYMFHGGSVSSADTPKFQMWIYQKHCPLFSQEAIQTIANRIGCKYSFKNPWIMAIQHPFTFQSITKTHFRFEFIHSPMINVLIVKPNPLCNPFWFLQVFTVIGTSHVFYSISSMFTG